MNTSSQQARKDRQKSKIDKKVEQVRGVLDSGITDARTRADAAQGDADTAQARADAAYERTVNIQSGQIGDKQVVRRTIGANAVGESELSSSSANADRAVAGKHIKTTALALEHFGVAVVPSSALEDVAGSKLRDRTVVRTKIALGAVSPEEMDRPALLAYLDTIYQRI